MSRIRVTAVERVVRIVARGGTGVATINVEAPLTSTGGSTPTLGILAATPTSPGTLSAADKAKLDALADPTLSSIAPPALGVAFAGTSTQAARGDHVHAHGAQAGGGLHSTATSLQAGFMAAADKSKLDGIAAGAQVNVPTNLGVGGTGDARTITSSTGGAAALPLATGTTAGLLSTFYFTLLSQFAVNVRDQVLAMLQQGTNVTLTPAGVGDSRTITISSAAGGGSGDGTVTSVALSLPGIFSVSGSPVTTAGTLSATLASQTLGRVWASPADSDGAPVFRVLVQSDIPSLSASKLVLSENSLIGQTDGSAATTIALGAGFSFTGTTLNYTAPVTSVSGRTGAVTLTDTDVPAGMLVVSGSTKTLALTDRGLLQKWTLDGAKTLTVNTGTGGAAGEYHVWNAATSGDLSVTATGVTVVGGALVLAPGDVLTLKRTDTNEFLPIGGGATSVAWADVTGKPTTFPPETHTHTAIQITDFNSASRAQAEEALVAGTNVTITPAGSGATRTLTIAASGGGGSLTVQDEGSTLSTGVTTINFTGAGVTATGGTTVTVDIPGGEGGGFNFGVHLAMGGLVTA